MKIFGALILFFGLSISTAQAQEGHRYWECKNPIDTEETTDEVDPIQTENQISSEDYEKAPAAEKDFSAPQGGYAPTSGERPVEAVNAPEKACDENWSVPTPVPSTNQDNWGAPTPPGLIFLKY